jgi:hypothetical protein
VQRRVHGYDWRDHVGQRVQQLCNDAVRLACARACTGIIRLGRSAADAADAVWHRVCVIAITSTGSSAITICIST